jgi:hypothetical protein
VIVASFHDFLHTWAPLAAWAVAAGTLALALATWWLGTKARKEAESVGDQAKAVSKQVELEQQQLEASQRPFVLPITEGWGPWMFWPGERQFPLSLGASPEPWMMLSNSGAGPAINIRGGLYWHRGIGGGWQVIPTSIGAGEHVPTNLEAHAGYEVKWPEAEGYLRYSDLAGSERQTRFRYRQKASGQYAVEVTAAGKTSDLGEPDYTT